MFEYLMVSIIWQMGRCVFRVKAELALGVMVSVVLVYTRGQ